MDKIPHERIFELYIELSKKEYGIFTDPRKLPMEAQAALAVAGIIKYLDEQYEHKNKTNRDK